MCLLEFDVCGLPQLAECDNNINRFSEEGSISTEEKIAFVSHVFELAMAKAIGSAKPDGIGETAAWLRHACAVFLPALAGEDEKVATMREDNTTLISALNRVSVEQMDGQCEGGQVAAKIEEQERAIARVKTLAADTSYFGLLRGLLTHKQCNFLIRHMDSLVEEKKFQAGPKVALESMANSLDSMKRTWTCWPDQEKHRCANHWASIMAAVSDSGTHPNIIAGFDRHLTGAGRAPGRRQPARPNIFPRRGCGTVFG